MLETTILAAQAVSVAFMAAWLTIGALENLLHPFLNETYTAEVMDMTRMREEYPEAYRFVAYRRVTSSRLRRGLFRCIVVWEIAATAALWAGSAALAMSAAGRLPQDTAIALGLAGTLMFTATWCGFLIAGNWFCYWFGHEGGQNTHFQMTLWGMLNAVLLVGGAVVVM
ncbi:DUF2165 domain-containing protein [Leisingera sp. D0M16]|uniref:DUF2165 domain-containing protein n=1 Tax=Leisingera coralii TaxID=3351347 RepID=UPI003B7D6F45